MSGETWLLFAEILITFLIIGFAAFVIVNKKIENKDRYFGFLGIAIAAFGLGFSGWQYGLAAKDSRESADASREAAVASKDSADSARASLAIEKAPALTLDCNLYAKGKPQGYFPLNISAQDNYEPQTPPELPSRHISYLTCVINNYGRQPILNAQLKSVLNFTLKGGIDVSIMPGLDGKLAPAPIPGAPKPRPVGMQIDGIAAGGTYTFWAGNESITNGFLFQRPLSITFDEPDGTNTSFNFASAPTSYLYLEARTAFAPGEKHGFVKVTRQPLLRPGNFFGNQTR